VPSDIATDQLYLTPEKFATRSNLITISAWTDINLMKINTDKTNYMLFTRAKTSFGTRLSIKNVKMENVQEAKIVAVWLSPDLKWAKNTKELTIKAYSRLGMLTKQKYVWVATEDLLDIYVLYIRSVLEYCGVMWHSGLNTDQIRI
jgi:hypothetical protein